LCELAFDESHFSQISIDSGNVHFKIVDSFLVDFEGKSLIWRFGLSNEVVVPKWIARFSRGALRGCHEIIFGRGISRIAERALLDCPSVSSVFIPSSVETIGEEAFSGCHALSTVSFESNSGLTRIEIFAFRDCWSLTSFCVPSSVQRIRQGCFMGCRTLSTITFESGSKLSKIDRNAFPSCWALSAISAPAHLLKILRPYQDILKLQNTGEAGNTSTAGTIVRRTYKSKQTGS
jgi:hypothetical protein